MRRTVCLLVLSVTFLPLVHGDEWASWPVAPGVTYSRQRLEAGPWEVRVLRLKRDARQVRLDMALGMGLLKGVEEISGIVARESAPRDVVVAAVNGDFFVMAGNPNAGLLSGMAVRNGELIMAPRQRPTFWVGADGTPHIGLLRMEGVLTLPTAKLPVRGLNQPPVKDGVTVYSAIFGWPVEVGGVVVRAQGLPLRTEGKWEGVVSEVVPAKTAREVGLGELFLHGAGGAAAALERLQPGARITLSFRTTGVRGAVQLAVGGNEVLLRGGQVLPMDDPHAPRHPRTIIGFNAREVLLVTVDGRQPGWSVGMTSVEEARLMLRLGCTDALNLDGGGSTTCWVRGAVTNRPSDGKERKVANALLIRSTAPHGPLARLTVEPAQITAVSRARVPLSLMGTDLWFNPVELNLQALQLSVRRVTGQGWISARLVDGALRVAGLPGTGMVRFSLPGVGRLAEVPLTIVDRCPKLTVTPELVRLCAGESFALSVHGAVEDGTRVWLPPRSVKWQVEGSGITSLGDGQFRADTAGAEAKVRATWAEATGVADVQVARSVPVEGFEAAPELKVDRFPKTEDTVTVQAQIQEGDAGEGTRFARLSYDLGPAKGTRAAYLQVDRELGGALGLSALTRGTASSPAWLRVAIVDGNGTRQTYTLADAVTWSNEWRRVSVRLPDGLKRPLRWEAVYVVALDGKTSRGTLDLDDLRAETVN